MTESDNLGPAIRDKEQATGSASCGLDCCGLLRFNVIKFVYDVNLYGLDLLLGYVKAPVLDEGNPTSNGVGAGALYVRVRGEG